MITRILRMISTTAAGASVVADFAADAHEFAWADDRQDTTLAYEAKLQYTRIELDHARADIARLEDWRDQYLRDIETLEGEIERLEQANMDLNETHRTLASENARFRCLLENQRKLIEDYREKYYGSETTDD